MGSSSDTPLLPAGFTRTPNVRPFRLVYASKTGAHLYPRDEFVMRGPGADLESFTAPAFISMRVSTRWEPSGQGWDVPRELLYEVACATHSFREAQDMAFAALNTLATVIAVTANTHVEAPRFWLGWDSSSGATKREFAQANFALESAILTPGRWVTPARVNDLFHGFANHVETARLGRALGHYAAALRNWNSTDHLLVLTHLWISSETLCKAIERQAFVASGLSEADFATSLGVSTEGRGWQYKVSAEISKRHIFAGSERLRKLAKDASDGFEHGYMELEQVRSVAKETMRELAKCVRDAILRFISLEPGEYDSIPLDSSPLRKMLFGYLTGSAPVRLSSPDESGLDMPRLTWTTEVRSVDFSDKKFSVSEAEHYSAKFPPGVDFELLHAGISMGLNVESRITPGGGT